MGCGSSVDKTHAFSEEKQSSTVSTSSNTAEKYEHQLREAANGYRTVPPKQFGPPPPLPKGPPGVSDASTTGAFGSRERPRPAVHASETARPNGGTGGAARTNEDQNLIKVDLRLFEQLEILDETPMSTVVRLRQRQTRKLFAGKRIRKNDKVFSSGDYLNEVRVLQKLSSVSAVVGLHGVAEMGLDVWTILELCEGGRVEQWLQKHPKSTESVAVAIVEAVQQLHTLLICHLDIKPDNVMLTSQGHVRLIDFVTSCQLGAEEQLLVGNCGTEGFKAPEVSVGKEYSGLAADMFSLGCTLKVVSQFAPRWSALSRLCKDLMAQDPKRRPSASRASQYFSQASTLDPTDFDFSSLETVSCHQVASVAQAPPVRGRWSQASQASMGEQSNLPCQAGFRDNRGHPSAPLPFPSQAVEGNKSTANKKVARQAPPCGSATCARVGICLCDDKPPADVSLCRPSMRAGASKGLRRCNTP